MPNGIENLPPLTLRRLSTSDGLPELVEKVQYNFDQILLNGGGPKGESIEGRRGLPGATGSGKKGDPGEQGSLIYFEQTNIVDGQTVTNPAYREDDVVIDSQGDYFKLEEIGGTLQYTFQFNISSASAGNQYWQNQDEYGSGSITEHVLFNFGSPTDIEKNLVVANKDGSTSEYYRLLVGIDTYPAAPTQNASFIISNIPHNDTQDADQQFFSQLGLKYRHNSSQNVSANTIWHIYKEEQSNDRYLYTVTNLSVATIMNHNTSDSDNSEYLIKGRNVRLIGKSADIDNITRYLDFLIDPTESSITVNQDLRLKSDDANGELHSVFIKHNIDTNEITLNTISGSELVFNSTSIDIKYLVSSGNFEVDADEFIVSVDGIKIGRDSGTNPVTAEVRQDISVVGSSGSEKIDLDVETEFKNRIDVDRVEVELNSSGELDITSHKKPIIFVKQSGGGDKLLQNIVGGSSKQILILRATEDIEVEDYQVSSGNIDIFSQSTVALPEGQHMVLYNNPDTGRYEQITSGDNSHITGFNDRGFASSITLEVFKDVVHQRITSPGAVSLGADAEIRLLRKNARPGSTFVLHLDFDFDLNGHTFQITDNSPATVIKDFTIFDQDLIGTSSGNGEPAKILCVFTGTQWIVTGYYTTLTGFSGYPLGIFHGGDRNVIDADTLSSTPVLGP